MLGEKRSRAAFQGDSSGSVQDGRGAYAEKPGTGNVPLGYKEAGQKGTGRDGSGNAPAGYEKTGQAGTKDVPEDSPRMENVSESSTRDVNFPESSTRTDMHTPASAGEESPETEAFPETGDACAAPRREARTLRTHGLFFEADAEGRDFASVSGLGK